MEFYFIIKGLILLAVFFGIIALFAFAWKVFKIALIVIAVLVAVSFIGKVLSK